MEIKNTWNTENKQSDKIMIKVRFGKLTLFDLNVDVSKKRFTITLANFIFRF